MKINIILSLTALSYLLLSCNTTDQNNTLQTYATDSAIENSTHVNIIPIPSKETVETFYDAINSNETEKALAMVGTDFPGDYEPPYKITPLKAAIWRNNILLVKKLVQHNANIHKAGDLAVEEAAEYGMYEILEYLIQQKADLNNEAFSKAKDYRCAKLLLEHNANQEMGDVRGKLNFYLQAVEKNDLPSLKLLTLHADDINYNNCDGQTALLIAIKKEYVEIIAYLLKSGINPSKPETVDCGDDISTGKTPLELATETKNKEVIQLVQEALKKQ